MKILNPLKQRLAIRREIERLRDYLFELQELGYATTDDDVLWVRARIAGLRHQLGRTFTARCVARLFLAVLLCWLFVSPLHAAPAAITPEVRRIDKQIAAAKRHKNWARARKLAALRRDLITEYYAPEPIPTPIPVAMPTPASLVAPWYVPTGWQWPATVVPEISDPLVLVCAGQSNMVGAEQSAATVPAALRVPLEHVYIWQPNGWAAYLPGVNFPTWGPEAEFARRFRAAYPLRTLLIVKYAVGGTQLAKHATLGDWSPNSEGELFDFMAQVRAESTAAGASGEAALLWLQGESDGFSLDAARTYDANLRAFVAAARDRWALDSAKIIIATIHTGEAYPIPYAAIIRAAQSKVAAEFELPTIDTAGVPLTSRRMHFTAAGQVMVGAAFFAAAMSP